MISGSGSGTGRVRIDVGEPRNPPCQTGGPSWEEGKIHGEAVLDGTVGDAELSWRTFFQCATVYGSYESPWRDSIVSGILSFAEHLQPVRTITCMFSNGNSYRKGTFDQFDAEGICWDGDKEWKAKVHAEILLIPQPDSGCTGVWTLEEVK